MDQEALICSSNSRSLPLWFVREGDLAAFKTSVPAAATWLNQLAFAPERHRIAAIPGPNGEVAGAVVGLGLLADWSQLAWWHVSGLVDRLPARDFHIEGDLPPAARYQILIGWLHGGYQLTRYKSMSPRSQGAKPRLVLPSGIEASFVLRQAKASAWARDLINAPANELGPAELASIAADLAREHAAELRCLEGDDLLVNNFPLIHAVGRASIRSPRLIDLRWGDPRHPTVTLVGKGACFDTGGLDIKSSAGMALMKKDMGGAAIVLALASSLMTRRAPIRLRVLIPAVENSIAGTAYRPGDVLCSRRGLTVEIGNTDAEGRLILADALTEADVERPSLLLDFSTLTGAARVALGPELPAVFGVDRDLVEHIRRCGDKESDPVWPMPLWDPYDEELASRIADINNVSSSSFAGAIFGALFLRRFVSSTRFWAHFDLYAWNARERPGRPVGAEAQCLRLADRLILDRFGT
ncbi:MAG: leucyl aminopeptidase family protein [Gammaproteobacteria bacterium]|nr:leucyl aminopeptidase family protein [Gammaproteobacteria bacterium]